MAPATPEAIVASKLKKPLDGVSFTETPLREVLDYISESAEVDVMVDRHLRAILEEAGLTLNEPVNLEIRHTKLPAAAVLELALDQSGLGEIAGYTIRDGLVYITSRSQSNQIQVYNVRDLVATRFGGDSGMGMDTMMADPSMMGAAGMPGMGMGGYGAGFSGRGTGMTGGGGMPGGDPMAMGGGMGMSAGGTSLTQVIRSTIRPQTWAEAGGEAGLAEYNGLLIVKAGQEVHREIEQLLRMMRSSMRGGPGEQDAASMIIPVP
jgi:hypothetical protein